MDHTLLKVLNLSQQTGLCLVPTKSDLDYTLDTIAYLFFLFLKLGIFNGLECSKLHGAETLQY